HTAASGEPAVVAAAAALAAPASMVVPAVGVSGGEAVVAVMEAAGLWCGGRKLPASGCSDCGGWLGGSGGGWCSGAGCRRAAAVEMVTDGSKGVSGVACRGLNRSGRWGVFWSFPEKKSPAAASGGGSRRPAGWGGRERSSSVCIIL
nr:hypothetical protein [Tanacetum cinerariifolium]